ncbi:solanesyl-diphosphate synthase 1, mitochondrial-like isoform X5 [Panicum virgatum]|uniref:solanesyl-diphosphate synthase 1, mitochondrial-like isoform X5 n=1 Tax=Panicum virgatum TaxID=38727 RepID=UPI0019D5D5A8|nr:solanesyl-diphosphate synthase 1, mitochondrial-like isoform X5 [Panicum virgatum]
MLPGCLLLTGLLRSASTASSAPRMPKEQLDPLALIKDEVSEVTDRLRSMVVAEVPELTSAAGYFFSAGAEGKRTCPTVRPDFIMCFFFPYHYTIDTYCFLVRTSICNLLIQFPHCKFLIIIFQVLLLMASAISMKISDGLENRSRARHMRVAEITEMIHISSLIHDDVLDDADTRRGMDSLNFTVGKKLAVLAGDFLLFRAFSAAVSLDNTEVVSLLATAVNNLVTGELMQMSITPAQRCSMDYYLQKTYYKTAALISNSCKAIAVITGQTAEIQALAYQYGRHLGIAYQLIDDILDFTGTTASLGKASLSDIHQGIVTAPILFAMEEFPELCEIVEQGFDDPSNVEIALKYLSKSQGIEKTRLLAAEHAKLAADAIDGLPESEDQVILNSRQALKDLTQKFMRRTK